MELLVLQKLFYEAILKQDQVSYQTLCQHIKAAQGLEPAQGLAIYRGSVMGKLVRTLRAIYPVCYRLVGEKFFKATAEKFIHCYPSFSPDLGNYGQQFSDFLADFEPVVTQLPYLPDVARLEWFWHRIFNGEETTPLDLDALGKVSQDKWGDLILHIPKNSMLLESIYPIHRIWAVNQPDYEGHEQVSLAEGGVKIFLWRQHYTMRIDLPSEEEWQLLAAFKQHKRFEEVCETLLARTATLDIPQLLAQVVQRGWITHFSLAA